MEVLVGTNEEKKALRYRLDSTRLFHYRLLNERFQDIQIVPLGQFLRDPIAGTHIDIELFCRGVERFLRSLGAYVDGFRALPLDRVFIGTGWSEHVTLGSREELAEFGGCYSVYQSYYHLEEMAVTSLLGCYAGAIYDKRLTTLELLRSYFHDSIHYNTFRSYKLRYDHIPDAARLTDIHLYQIGFHIRGEDGHPPMADAQGDALLEMNMTTLIEGLTDDLSREALRRFMEEAGPSQEKLSRFEEAVLQECTAGVARKKHLPEDALNAQEAVYVAKMGIAHDTVWSGYERILDEYRDTDRDAFRALLFRAMIEGDHLRIMDYFNRRAGSARGFDRLFRERTF